MADITEFPIETATEATLPSGTPELTGATRFFFWLSGAAKVCSLATMKAAMAILPTGGTTGQVLAKASGTDGDVEWVDGGGGGGGGTITLTGDVTGSGTSTFATAIAANAVTNAKAAQMPTLTLKGNNTGSTANASDLSVADVSTMLGLSSYLALSGGTMTGHIELYGTASGAQAVSYSQVSTMLGSYLPLAGGAMTGHLDLYGTASGVQAISYAQVSSMVKGAVAQVGYYHTDTTVTSTPTSGKMTWNNATQISATSIYINLLDGDGTDDGRAGCFMALANRSKLAGRTAPKAQVRIAAAGGAAAMGAGHHHRAPVAAAILANAAMGQIQRLGALLGVAQGQLEIRRRLRRRHTVPPAPTGRRNRDSRRRWKPQKPPACR